MLLCFVNTISFLTCVGRGKFRNKIKIVCSRALFSSLNFQFVKFIISRKSSLVSWKSTLFTIHPLFSSFSFSSFQVEFAEKIESQFQFSKKKKKTKIFRTIVNPFFTWYSPTVLFLRIPNWRNRATNSSSCFFFCRQSDYVSFIFEEKTKSWWSSCG